MTKTVTKPPRQRRTEPHIEPATQAANDENPTVNPTVNQTVTPTVTQRFAEGFTAEEGAPFDADPPKAVASELVEMDAKSQALAIFKPQIDLLADFKRRFGPDVVVQYDLTTTKGNDAARADRLELVTARTSIGKRRKSLNEADQDRINTRNTVAKGIEAELAPYEEVVDSLIKADEKRRADEKAEAERIKREKEETVANAINDIRNVLVAAVGKTSVDLLGMEAELRETVIDSETFGIRYGEAVSAKDHVLGKLGEMLVRVLDLEARERQARADEERRQEEARQQAAKEEAERKAEVERQATIARENEERAARLAEEERQIVARRKALDDEEAAAKKKRQDAEDAERADRLAKEDAERTRVQRIKDLIVDRFTSRPTAMLNAGSVAISLARIEVEDWSLPPSLFDEFMGEAKAAQADAANQLRAMEAQARVAETAAAARKKADEEAAAARAQADAEATAARKKADDEAAAERKRQAEEIERQQARAVALTEHAEDMVQALSAVADDVNFHLLSEDTCYRVDNVRKAVAVYA